MNDEQMEALLEAWFDGTDPTPPDPRQTVVELIARVPQTRQRGRWWPFPLLRRKAETATAAETTDYRPGPIPATNGHAPTVIGRTRLMLSPVKAITVGALVLAIGGVSLIAQPFDRSEVAVPGAEAPEPTAVQVTVTQQCFDVDHDGCDWTASDPRLTGVVATEFGHGVAVEDAEAFEAGFQWIGNTFYSPEDGGWTGHVYALWGEPTYNFLVFSGTGANEGWHYIASGTDPDTDGDFEWLGTLYEGDLPPFPVAPSE